MGDSDMAHQALEVSYTVAVADDEESLPAPADIIRSEMEKRGWSQSDLAYVLGVKTSAVNPILSGKRGISPDMAKALASAFNLAPERFAVAQAEWELRRARDPDPSVMARARVQAEYPLREMMLRGWIKEVATSTELEAQLCRFFNVSSMADVPHLAHSAKKTEYSHIPASQLAWLFRVRQIAREMPTPPYSQSHLAAAVERMREMLGNPEEVRHIPRMLHESGVRFVIVEGLPGSKIDGVCFWLDKSSPVIGISLRFDRIDNFWFVLRHECAHVLHGHGQNFAIVDAELEQLTLDLSEEERTANSEASEFCVPQEKIRSFYLRKKPLFAERDVLAFSKIMRVHPGLVVGQLQKIAGRYDLLRRHLVAVRAHIAGSAMMDGWGDVVPVDQ
jgi:HTH-type transcriptional regulator/antitoxin HigA